MPKYEKRAFVVVTAPNPQEAEEMMIDLMAETSWGYVSLDDGPPEQVDEDEQP